MYEEIKGDLIKLALDGKFDVISHGCNCFCIMGAGIAPQMATAFGASLADNEAHRLMEKLCGEGYQIELLGNIASWSPYTKYGVTEVPENLIVVNSYTQYGFGLNHPGGSKVPLDYAALTLCMKKINHMFKGKHIGLPQIGCGLAGGDWEKVKEIIKTELKDCKVTIVIYKKANG